jgi:Xaa-Pro aminopeptidase
MYRLQSHASSREQELYREIGDISSRALTAFMDGLVRGDRQCDAAAEAGKIVIAAGGGFQRLGCHTGPRGDHAAWDYPLYGYSREAASRGEFVRAWVVGPVLEGYWIDPGRTSVCGLNPTSAQRALIEEAITTVNRITDEVRPGRTPREVGAIVDATTDRSDLGIYGHGLSTFWLGPLIPAQPFEPDPGDTLFDADEPFRDGQIFTSETFINEPGVGTAGFEDVFIVREGGNELLTTTPQLFW